jgi:hypothetical protein
MYPRTWREAFQCGKNENDCTDAPKAFDFDHGGDRCGRFAPRLSMNQVALVGSENTYRLPRSGAEGRHSLLLNAQARRGGRMRMSIQQWIKDDRQPAIDPIAWQRLLRDSD